MACWRALGPGHQTSGPRYKYTQPARLYISIITGPAAYSTHIYHWNIINLSSCLMVLFIKTGLIYIFLKYIIILWLFSFACDEIFLLGMTQEGRKNEWCWFPICHNTSDKNLCLLLNKCWPVWSLNSTRFKLWPPASPAGCSAAAVPAVHQLRPLLRSLIEGGLPVPLADQLTLMPLPGRLSPTAFNGSYDS